MKYLKSAALLVTVAILLAGCYPMPPLIQPALTSEPVPPPASPSVSASAAPNTVLVRYQPLTPQEKKNEARAQAKGKLAQEYELVPGLEKLSVSDVPGAIQALRHQPFVLYAEPDYIVSIDDAGGPAPDAPEPVEGTPPPGGAADSRKPALDTIPSDPRFGELWGMQKIDALKAWDLSRGSEQVIVAVIDTGIDYTHPDLAANIWTNPGEIAGNGVDDDKNGFIDDVHGYDFLYREGDPMDDHFHGTHVAGTIGAVGNNGEGVVGVNWAVKLMALKFINSQGIGSTSNAILALQYAVKMGAHLSNNSWGGGAYSQALFDAIRSARSAGHIFVASAGNSGVNIDLQASYPASFDLDNIISVAAIDSAGELPLFSNWGVKTVDLAAPGENVLSTMPGGGYATYGGTSMAAPHVTGVAALLTGMHPDWRYSQIKNQLLATTAAAPALSGKVLTGGIVNAFAALNASDPGTVPTPTPTAVPTVPPPDSASGSLSMRDLPVDGRVSGTYQDTWVADGVAESITEKAGAGNPDTRYDLLEHWWEFYVPAGTTAIEFRSVAWASASADEDQMLFYYSTDKSTWIEMFAVQATAQTADAQEYSLPAPSVAGKSVFIRVRDSRSMPSFKAIDTVYVDYMVIAASIQ